jgi:hypothetical protein
MSFYEVERARHEREAIERDEREAVRAQAEIDDAIAREVAERRAEIDARVYAAYKDACRATIDEFIKRVGSEDTTAKERLDSLLIAEKLDYGSLLSAYEVWAVSQLKRHEVNDAWMQNVGHTPGIRRPEPELPSFASIVQEALERRGEISPAEASRLEFRQELRSALHQAWLDANELRPSE